MKYVDPTGHFFDIVVDVGFILFDIYQLIKEPSWENAAYLGMDVAAAFVPFLTGVGAAARGAKAAKSALNTAETTVKGTGKSLRELGLKNGMKIKTNDAHGKAEQFLGPGYKDMGNGRFVSADGTRVVRMGDSVTGRGLV